MKSRTSHAPFRAGLLVGILAVTLVFGVGLWAAGRRTDAATEVARVPGFDEVITCGPAVTAEAASKAMPFTVLEADSGVANESNLRDIELCPGGTVAFWYTNGVLVTEETTKLPDPKAEWEQNAKDFPEFSVGTVRGVPAALADPTYPGAKGGVHLVDDGVEIIVRGNGKASLDELTAVAESLAPITSSPTPSPASG
jgi:hypothetical protein